MKRIPIIYSTVFLGALIQVGGYLLYGWGMATYYCGFNLWFPPPGPYDWGIYLMIAEPLLWITAIILGSLGCFIPEMRKSFLIHMTVCYCIDLASYIGMYFIPTYWVIPLTPMKIVLYLIAVALCVVALRRMGKDHEDRPKTAADRAALPPDEINALVKSLHDKLDSDL